MPRRVSVAEGNAGTTTLTFVVTLMPPSRDRVSVDYATLDGTATAGSDYQPASGTLSFAPGETAKTISITGFGDTSFEPDVRGSSFPRGRGGHLRP